MDEKARALCQPPLLDVWEGTEVNGYRWAVGAGNFSDVVVVGIPAAHVIEKEQRGNHLFLTEFHDLGADQAADLGRVLEIRSACFAEGPHPHTLTLPHPHTLTLTLTLSILPMLHSHVRQDPRSWHGRSHQAVVARPQPHGRHLRQ